MMIELRDPGDGKSSSLAEIDGDSLPPVGEVFVTDGYPFVCMRHFAADEENDHQFPGVEVGEAPPETIESFLKPGCDERAKASYAFSRSISPVAAPLWKEASPLTRRKFRLDAEGFGDELKPVRNRERRN